MVQIGDAIAVPQGPYRRTVRVISLGVRRGPASEARTLYEETEAPRRLSEFSTGMGPAARPRRFKSNRRKAV